MPDPRPTAPPYRHVSWCYDALASGYSLGAIDRSKRFHHAFVEEGDRVLYAGAGRGREIIGACQRGAKVTCVEPCPAMAEALHQRLGESCDGFTIVPRPIQGIPAEPEYDMVVAHYFLNVFDREEMPRVLEHLCDFVKPGGRIVIADFKSATEDAGMIDRATRSLYYKPVNVVGRVLGICALHPIYNYAPLLMDRGFELQTGEGFCVIPGIPSLYETLVAQRKK